MSPPVPPSRITIPPEIEAEMTPAVKEFVLAAFAALESRIEELERQLQRLTPQNSSLPPSTQHPHAKPKREELEPAQRKRGGQPGHRQHCRKLLPPEECQQIIVSKPSVCRCCRKSLAGSDPQPVRHQVWELPPLQPIVIEYQLHRLRCKNCGRMTCGELPAGVPAGQSGPRLVAFTGLLMGHFRQSKRRAAMFLQDFLKMPCAASLTVKMQNQVAAALHAPYRELQNCLAEQRQLFMDETPTKQAQQKAWLWTAVAPLMAVFAIFSSRKAEAIPKLLGNSFSGIINCDRAKMYWQAKRLQWCWAHLKRDFQAWIDHHDVPVQRLGQDLMRQVKLMFQHWRCCQSGQMAYTTFQQQMEPIRQEIDGLLLRGAGLGHPTLRGTCKELSSHREWLWTFVEVEGIEPTNNAAERALRPAVIHRKLSFGTQSESGSRFVERMLTVSETCRLQNRSVYDFLVAAVTASYHRQPAPSLLPAKAT
jgi:transposase